VLLPSNAIFEMGDLSRPIDRFEVDFLEPIRHWRRIPRAFAISTFELTCEEYGRRIKGPFPAKLDVVAYDAAHPNKLSQSKPRNGLLWQDAAEYCMQLKSANGEDCFVLTPESEKATGSGRYSLRPDFCMKTGFRPPTEAEWEYAARAGSRTKYWFGFDPTLITSFGHSKDNQLSDPLKSPRMPNLFGLFDVHGGVREWTSSPVKSYPPNLGSTAQTPIDDLCSDSFENRPWIMRGDSYNASDDKMLGSYGRFQGLDGFRSPYYGLRLCRTWSGK
jgi:formylglycine-generating enzyme required for sulfatase activity